MWEPNALAKSSIKEGINKRGLESIHQEIEEVEAC